MVSKIFSDCRYSLNALEHSSSAVNLLSFRLCRAAGEVRKANCGLDLLTHTGLVRVAKAAGATGSHASASGVFVPGILTLPACQSMSVHCSRLDSSFRSPRNRVTSNHARSRLFSMASPQCRTTWDWLRALMTSCFRSFFSLLR